MRIIVAVSGGIDSLYTLLALKKDGHDVAALHARFINTETSPIADLSIFCKEQNIPFYVADLRDEFCKNVIKPFLNAYAEGQTPNPCATCNKSLKFGRLLEIARNYSAQFLATGHYACLEPYILPDKSSFSIGLKSADDKTKNQSYFLALTPLSSLRHCLFPLAHKHKKEIEAELSKHEVKIPIPKESQEVCFIPSDNYREFIENNAEKFSLEFSGQGKIVLLNKDIHAEKILGEHKGLWNYTEGQRKGIGIAHSEPLYVIKKDYVSNILYVGNQDYLYINSAKANQLNFFVPPSLWPNKLWAQCRYKEKPTEVDVFIQGQDFELNLATCQDKLFELEQQFIYAGSKDQENLQQDSKLFHVQLDDLIYENKEEEHYFQKINAWNKANLSLKVVFKEAKQVYAKGQILAIYDENNFILAGGILS